MDSGSPVWKRIWGSHSSLYELSINPLQFCFPLFLLSALCLQPRIPLVQFLTSVSPPQVGCLKISGCSEEHIGYFKLNGMMLTFIWKKWTLNNSKGHPASLSNTGTWALPGVKLYYEAPAIQSGPCKGKGWQLYGRQSQKKSQHTHVEILNTIKVAFHICKGKVDYNRIFIATLFIKTKN